MGMFSKKHLMAWFRLYAAAGPAVFIVPAYAIIVLISIGLFLGIF